jgi:imidazolonepropionase
LRGLSIIEQGAMLIRNGAIERVGPQAILTSQLPSDCEIVDAGNGVVLPGFVDAHTHPIFAGTRVDEFERRTAGATYEEIATAGGGIRSTVRKTRAASEDELFQVAERRADWFLRGGTTTIEAKSGYGLALEDELKMLRVIRRLNSAGPLRYVSTFLGAHEVPDEYRGHAAEYVDLVIDQMLPRVAREKLAEYCDVFSEPSAFDLSSSRKILEAAKAFGCMPINLRILELLNLPLKWVPARQTTWSRLMNRTFGHWPRRAFSRCCCRRRFTVLAATSFLRHGR